MNFQIAFAPSSACQRAGFSQGVLVFTGKPPADSNFNVRPLNPADPLPVIIKQE